MVEKKACTELDSSFDELKKQYNEFIKTPPEARSQKKAHNLITMSNEISKEILELLGMNYDTLLDRPTNVQNYMLLKRNGADFDCLPGFWNLICNLEVINGTERDEEIESLILTLELVIEAFHKNFVSEDS